MTDALHRDAQALERVGAQPEPGCRFHALEDTDGGHRGGVAAGFVASARQAGHEVGLLLDEAHVVDAAADVLGRNVFAAETVHRAPERMEQLRRLGRVVACKNDRLAAAESEAGHRVLVRHAARQAQRVGQRSEVRRILPAAATTRRRAECRRVDGNDCLEPCLLVPHKMQRLMLVEFGVVENGHRKASTGAYGVTNIYPVNRTFIAKSFAN